MGMFDPIPQARVVRKAGQLVAPPPLPKSDELTGIAKHLRDGFAIAMGMWPLTAVVLLIFGLLIMAGNSGGNPYR